MGAVTGGRFPAPVRRSRVPLVRSGPSARRSTTWWWMTTAMVRWCGDELVVCFGHLVLEHGTCGGIGCLLSWTPAVAWLGVL
jgi:hypothetical protein